MTTTQLAVVPVPLSLARRIEANKNAIIQTLLAVNIELVKIVYSGSNDEMNGIQIAGLPEEVPSVGYLRIDHEVLELPLDDMLETFLEDVLTERGLEAFFDGQDGGFGELAISTKTRCYTLSHNTYIRDVQTTEYQG